MKFKIGLAVCGLLAMLSGCAALQQGQAFAKCKFAISKLHQMNLAGMDVDNLKSVNDMNLLQAGKVAATYASGKLPLTATANLNIQNPNASMAALNKLDWILEIDGTDVLEGTSNERVEIAPNSSAEMPLTVSMDLRKVFKGKKLDYIKEFSSDVLKNREGSERFAVKVKPYFNFLGAQIPYPGYIRLTKVLKKE